VSRKSPSALRKALTAHEAVPTPVLPQTANYPPLRDRLGAILGKILDAKGHISKIETSFGPLHPEGKSGKDDPAPETIDYLVSELQDQIEELRLRIEAIMVRI
jgi:hypothetical protein